MTDARTIIATELPDLFCDFTRGEYAPIHPVTREFTAAVLALLDSAVAAPTTDARTIIAEQLGGTFESNGSDNDWTDQADAVLAALSRAGFEVCAAHPADQEDTDA